MESPPLLMEEKFSRQHTEGSLFEQGNPAFGLMHSRQSAVFIETPQLLTHFFLSVGLGDRSCRDISLNVGNIFKDYYIINISFVCRWCFQQCLLFLYFSKYNCHRKSKGKNNLSLSVHGSRPSSLDQNVPDYHTWKRHR